MMQNLISPFNGTLLEKRLQVKDYLISGELFDLYYDSNWDMLITHPQPENLSTYYKSENYQPHRDKGKNLFDRIYVSIRNYSFRYKYK